MVLKIKMKGSMDLPAVVLQIRSVKSRYIEAFLNIVLLEVS